MPINRGKERPFDDGEITGTHGTAIDETHWSRSFPAGSPRLRSDPIKLFLCALARGSLRRIG
jgi:hypothetical protein